MDYLPTLSTVGFDRDLLTGLAIRIIPLLLVILLIANFANGKKDGRFPPIPPSTFLLGHLPSIIRENQNGTWHIFLAQWARKYGPIFGVKTGPIVDYYINSDALVKELFDKQSAQTADRPTWIMSNEILNNEWNVLFLDAKHPNWKNQRKVIHNLLTTVPKAQNVVPILEFETGRFLREGVLARGESYSGASLYQAIGRYTYSTFSTMLFGLDVPKIDDTVIEFIKQTEIQIIYTFPGTNIIDIFPQLGKLPLFLKPWERSGQKRFQRDLEWIRKRLLRVKELIACGHPAVKQSFLAAILEQESLLGFESEEEAAWLAFSLISAAGDTSRMSTWGFLEAMARFPDVQKKAQTLIDAAVGDRIPVWNDFEDIPYIRMLMKEVWRWKPPVALGHPHITSREIRAGEYVLPKGARIHINAYAIGHDPERHESPEQFWPERYEDDNTSTMESINSKDVKMRDHFAFGSGRRICPGYHIAERSIAVAIMRILWTFNVVEDSPTPINYSNFAGVIPGVSSENLPVKLVPRSQEKSDIVLKSYSDKPGFFPDMVPLSLGENQFPQLH